MSEILDVVNEQNEIIGQAERDEVHGKGLLCRLVYVCFYTPSGEVLLQKRSLTKKNDPGKLTTAVSGHVGTGQDFIEAALREAYEETGIEIDPNNLTNLGAIRANFTQGSYISNAFRGLFAYEFTGTIADLKVEDGEGAGFASMHVDELERQLQENPKDFAISLSGELGTKLVQGVKRLIGSQ